VPSKPTERFRQICLTLPEVVAKPYGKHFTYRVRNKNFAMQMNNHHGDGRIAVWCKADRGVQEMLVETDPKRYFVPPYVGPSGWVGARLDVKVDWGAVTRLVNDGYRLVAPKRLMAEIVRSDERPASKKSRRARAR
jgi:hypothetical protein